MSEQDTTTELAENQSNKPPLLISVEKRQQAIIDACSGSVEYISILSSLQKAITKDNRILQCNPSSVLDAMLACAKLGIDPSGEHNSGWFIRYGSDLKLMIGYNGFIDLITRSGRYSQVEAEVVYEGEVYEVHRGTRNEIIHSINPKVRNGTEGNIIGAYAVARGDTGVHQFVALSNCDIQSARSASKNANLWNKHYPEMVKKTAVRNLAKWMVLDRIGQQATAISDDGDGYDFGRRQSSNPDGMNKLQSRVHDLLDKPSEQPQELPENTNQQSGEDFANDIAGRMDEQEQTKGIE